MYRVTKVISAALLAFIIVTAVTVGLGSMADDGVILDAWYAMIGYIPFGNVLAPLCVDLFSESFNLGKNMSEYLIGIKALTMLDFFQDVVILLLTAVCCGGMGAASAVRERGRMVTPSPSLAQLSSA